MTNRKAPRDGPHISWDILAAVILTRNGRELSGPQFRAILNEFLQHPPNGVRPQLEVLQASGAIPSTLSNAKFQQLRHRLVTAGFVDEYPDPTHGHVTCSKITLLGLRVLGILSAITAGWVFRD